MKRLLFLSWESPWPARDGAALRTLGLLKELSKAFEVDLVVLTRNPLSREQTQFLSTLACTLERVPLKDISYANKLSTAWLMFKEWYPYHCAILRHSLRDHYDLWLRIIQYPGIVFTSLGHWGTLIHDQKAPNWILNQCDAEVDFWRVYASQADNRFARMAALINYRLARRHFPGIYSNVGRIISVCQEDKYLTLELAHQAQIDVIENGVDCSYYVPERTRCEDSFRLLFTGNSAARNRSALRHFIHHVLPLIERELPAVELLVGGNFGFKAQDEFAQYHNVQFTGPVDDIRPCFNQSDVYIAPFEETHGSKLKIAEAMAMGMAIVSTPQGIRGFPLRDGESVLVAHTPQEFAASVVGLLKDSARRASMGDTARRVALSTIDWKVLGKRLLSIAESMCIHNQANVNSSN